MNMPKPKDKPFVIPKSMVWEAYRRVAANKGAPGVDGQALDEFEADLRDNLYRIWNRMSSGSYFPPPVRAVEIPKPHGGGVRVLGVPTISDRIAQTVVAMQLEPLVEPRFHPDSYGYRPGKSALEAIGTCRRRCWEFDWIIDLDVQKFFDTVPWDLVVKAVRAVTDCSWVLLYVKRWLAAPLQHPDGTLVERDKGTPQGSAVSPVLANLFMHYAFDAWIARNFPGCPFERYADDAVVHCKTRRQAEDVLAGIATRMERGGASASSRQDEDRLLQGQQPSGRARAHLVLLPRVCLPATGGTSKGRRVLHVVLAGDQSRGAQGQGRRSPQPADPSAHGPVVRRSGEMAEPHHRRVDELLRPVLPVGDLSAPAAHQHLPEALGWKEIPTAASPDAVQTLVGSGARPSTRPIRTLAMGSHVLSGR